MPSQLRARDVKKPQVQITNIVAKAQLVPPFTLDSLESKHPFDHGDNYNPKKVFHGARIRMVHNHYKFSIFRTGTVMSLVSQSFNDLTDSFVWLSSFLSRFDLQLSHKYDITNIAAMSNFFCSFDLFELSSYLFPQSSYDPSPMPSKKDDRDREYLVDCITYLFNDDSPPRYAALIFPSGKVVFTGFKSIPDLNHYAHKLSSRCSRIVLDHPEVLIK